MAEKGVINKQSNLTKYACNGVKHKIIDDQYWQKIVDSVNKNVQNLNKRNLIVLLGQFSWIIHNQSSLKKRGHALSKDTQMKILECIRNLITVSRLNLKDFKIEQLCIMTTINGRHFSKESSQFVKEVYQSIADSQKQTESSKELVQLLTTHYKFFRTLKSMSKDTQEKFDNLVKQEAKRYLDLKTLKNSQFAYILNYLIMMMKRYDNQSPIIEDYIRQLSQLEVQYFNIEDLTFIVSALSEISWSSKDMLLNYKTKTLSYLIDCLKYQVENQDFMTVQACTLLSALSALKSNSNTIIDMRFEPKENYALSLQELSEMIALKAMNQMPKGDYGLLYLILNNLRGCIDCGIIIQRLFCDRVRFVIETEGVQYLDGRVISLMGLIGLRDIEFWRYIEDVYLNKVLEKDEPFKMIECLVGLASIDRGTSTFTKLLQQKLLDQREQLSFLDQVRGYYALSIIDDIKLNYEFLYFLKDSIKDKLHDFSITTTENEASVQQIKMIDLISIMQSLSNYLNSAHSVRDTKENTHKEVEKWKDMFEMTQKLLKIPINQEGLNKRQIVSLFEIYGKIQYEDVFDQELKDIILTEFNQRFYTFRFDQFAQIAIVLKQKKQQEALTVLAERVISEQSIQNDSLTIKEMLKLLQQ